MTDFCFSAFMGYDILKKLGGVRQFGAKYIAGGNPVW